nr:F-box/FBD/LRR-repeat protein At1g13570-like [Ipomoea batatas]
MKTQTTKEQKKSSAIWMFAALYVISKVLNQHNGLIRKFVIGFQESWYYRKTLRSKSFYLDQWFLFVTRKGVEEIDLTLMDGDKYRLPNCIFSCPTLRRLHLNGVSVESINAYCTLPNVISLCFENFDFDGVDLPVSVDFPMNLSFIRCYNLPNLKITAKILDILVLNDSHFYHVPIYSNLRSLRVLELDCLKLNDVLGKLSEEFRSVAQGLEMLHNLNLVDFVAYEEEFVYIKGLLAFFPALEEVVIRRSEA